MRALDFIFLALHRNFRQPISSLRLIVITALFFLLTSNNSFWHHTLEVFPLAGENILNLLSLTVLILLLMVILFSIVNTRLTLKPVLILLLITSSLATYYISAYKIIINDEMIQNIVETSTAEAGDLLSVKMFVYLFFLGILPSMWVYKVKVRRETLKKEFISRLKVIALSFVVIIAMVYPLSKFYISFFKEHRTLRFHLNPIYNVYSVGYYINTVLNSGAKEFKKIGLDAKVVSTTAKKKLVILVVGEAARADHFSLNGYERETNPLLKKEDIINFSNFYACGTTTAVSVPCMFSVYSRSEYDYDKGHNTESLLDVLDHAGVDLLWRDNNSDSKGAALRVNFEDFKGKKIEGYYEGDEARDEAMIANLQSFIDQQKNDIFIVLHQMGNHGPAYYKRYPKAFEIFKPVCETNQLESCEDQTIANAYDNALLYTDYFLSQTIQLLKKNSKQFESAMIYISDHGESLGENGLYLHGLPYYIAPKAQKHVPAVMWFSENFGIDTKHLKALASQEFSQDYLFHSILGLMQVKTEVYNEKLDIFKQ